MWRPRKSGDHCASEAPSKQTLPRLGAQYPTNIRASDDFPEALGPMTPRPFPLCNFRDKLSMTGFCAPGGTTVAFSTARTSLGGCNGTGSMSGGSVANNRLSRSQLCRAEAQPLQWAIAISIGANARALRIELAMMIPADAC